MHEICFHMFKNLHESRWCKNKKSRDRTNRLLCVVVFIRLKAEMEKKHIINFRLWKILNLLRFWFVVRFGGFGRIFPLWELENLRSSFTNSWQKCELKNQNIVWLSQGKKSPLLVSWLLPTFYRFELHPLIKFLNWQLYHQNYILPVSKKKIPELLIFSRISVIQYSWAFFLDSPIFPIFYLKNHKNHTKSHGMT